MNFDPLVPTKGNKNEEDFEDIIVPAERLNLEAPPTINTSSTVTKPLSDIDLKDFDPLSQEEIEKGIETEKMSADLLRRSREVVSTRALAGKSWIERTLSQSSDRTSLVYVIIFKLLLVLRFSFFQIVVTPIPKSEHNYCLILIWRWHMQESQ